MSAPCIFISYRREDSSGHAGRLYDALAGHFGSDNVFIDVDTIRLGSDFAETIEQAVDKCDVLVALIGRGWMTAASPDGRRRLDDPRDFVRIELESALAHELSVIPVAVQGAAFLEADELPASLSALGRRQGIELRDASWQDDVKRLIRRLEGATQPTASNTQQPRASRWRWTRGRAIVVAAVVAVIVSGIALDVSRGGGSPAGTRGTQALRAAAPASLRASCGTTSSGDPSATASLECASSHVDVVYNLFASSRVLDGWYLEQQQAAGISRGSGSCLPPMFHGERPYAGGRQLCYLTRKGDAYIVWTDDRAKIGAQANTFNVTGARAARDLHSQWQYVLKP